MRKTNVKVTAKSKLIYIFVQYRIINMINNNYPVGICSEMCPDEEIIRREREKRIHILEIPPTDIKSSKLSANKRYMVKEFSRSAAGKCTQDIKNLRTQIALLKTVDYLLHDVITNENIPWNVVYDFITDRLRAVRQDMIIQNFSRAFCISLLQPMIKFYTYAAYRLCNQPLSVFDPHINNTHLQECLKRLLSMYDDLDILVSKFSNCVDIVDENLMYLQNRSFMEAIYLIHNLGNTIAMDRALQLPDLYKDKLVLKCLKISVEYWNGNFVRVCREILSLPVLISACAVLHLPKIRKRALATMSLAYSSKNSGFPIGILQKLLIYNNLEELLNDCAYYEIPTRNYKIFFDKNSFQHKTELPPKSSKFIDDLLSQQSIPTLLLEDNLEEFK